VLFADDVELQTALRESQTGGVSAVARYRGEQTEVLLDSSGSVLFRGSAEVQASSTVKAIGQAPSLVPKEKSDPLGTYGQEMALWRAVRLRDAERLIPLGVFRIVSARDSVERFRDAVAVDWSVTLTLADRFEAVKADDFLAVDSPVPGNLVWDEVRRLSPFPVAEALGNAAVPAATVYDSRLDAIVTLLQIIGGVPHLTREGVLTARQQDAWLTSTTALFEFPGVIQWSGEMSNDFYNQVKVSNPNDPSVVAYSALLDPWDPLAVPNAGGRTYKQASPVYSTVEEAQAGADTILMRVSSRRARTVNISCSPEALLLELGDVGWIRDPVQQRAVFGEVAALTIPLDPTRPVELELIVAIESPIVDDEIVYAPVGMWPSEGTFPSDETFPGG
jgi:hypothetical protein